MKFCKKYIPVPFNFHYRYQRIFGFILSLFLFFHLLFSVAVGYTPKINQDDAIKVGVAKIDITPEGPIRLAGYAARKNKESEGVLRRLHAKALAFRGDTQGTSILITVDLVGITDPITSEVAKYLSKKIGLNRAQLVICASHTHGGPEIGNLVNIIQYEGEGSNDSLLPKDQLVHIAEYIDQLTSKLEQVAMAAVEDLKPALVTRGQGQVEFATNRRQQGGPVDHSMPMLRVTNLDGDLRAILVSYACHGTTLGGDVNKVHGDWIGEAGRIIEKRHPGTIALVALGTAGDANPQPRGKLTNMIQHGKEIAAEVDRLLNSKSLHQLTVPPVGRQKRIKLPFAQVPKRKQLIQQSKGKGIKSYYARLALERMVRGGNIPGSVSYPVQVWTFGDELAMINLAGETVVDYSLRLKKQLGSKHIWINAYTNDVPCYIGSRRVIREGGYEAESSMYWYNKPSRFVEEVEDMIIGTVYELLPTSFLTK